MTRNTYKKEKNTFKYIVGMDEAGRGPLAGPMAVGAFCIEVSKTVFDTKRSLKKMFVGAKDSKKMTEKKREDVFEKIKLEDKAGKILYIVHMESAKNIDIKGLSWAIKNSIKTCLLKLKVDPKETLVLLDGGIKAPVEFVNQKTIIKGDDKEVVISLASICAKVTRDVLMKKLAKKYPEYGLEVHKGYGTLKHRQNIAKYGFSVVHRRSFCKNILMEKQVSKIKTKDLI
jgi:ribonuclease HII